MCAIKFRKIKINSLFIYALFYLELLIFGLLPNQSSYSFAGAKWIFLICLAIYFVGEVFVGLSSTKDNAINNVPTKIVVGTLLLNILLYLMAVLLPLGMLNNFYILLVFFASVYCICYKKTQAAGRKSGFFELAAVFFVPIATGLWCQDFNNVLAVDGENVVLQIWQDVYYHIAQINMWAASRGLVTISDLQMVGAPSVAYHHASYMLPALFAEASGESPLVAYTLILVPFGIMLMALSAFALGSVVFGMSAAAFASVGLLVLPDAFQLGYGNPYLSFHWLLQIGPALGFGIASAGIAFTYLFKYCEGQKNIYLFIGYLFVCVCLFHKAHIFVAVSYLAFVLPVFANRNWGGCRRSLAFLVLTTFYFFAIELARILNVGPTLVLDGSSLIEYSTMVANMQPKGLFKTLIEVLYSHFPDWRAVTFMGYLSVVSVSVSFIVYFIVINKLILSYGRLKAFFPLAVLFVYLITATFLAYDTNKVGAPEELLHRQFVWVYYATAVWGLAGIFSVASSLMGLQGNFNSVILVLLGAVALFVPYILGRGIQSNRIWGNGYQKVPICKFFTVDFIKSHSKRGEIVQDSLNDPTLFVTAFTGLPAYVIDAGGFRVPSGHQIRINNHAAYKIEKNPVLREKFISTTNISWYLKNPEDKFDMFRSLSEVAVYRCGDYEVYYFQK